VFHAIKLLYKKNGFLANMLTFFEICQIFFLKNAKNYVIMTKISHNDNILSRADWRFDCDEIQKYVFVADSNSYNFVANIGDKH